MSKARRDADADRARAMEIARRLQEDPAFRRQVETDPDSILSEAGVPAEAVADFMREVGVEADVSGYQGCTYSCFITYIEGGDL